MTEALTISYGITPAEVEAKRAAYSAITCDTTAGYESCRLAIADCRTMRTGIEKRRVALKADALAYGRRVDTVAKELTALIESLEAPLQAKKDAVDHERERRRRERDDAERAAVEAELRAQREAEQARIDEENARRAEALRIEAARVAAERALLEAEREQEAERLAAEREQASAALRAQQEQERARMAAERERFESERRAEREAQTAAQRQLDATRAAIEAERQRVERAEFERQARIRAEADAKAQAELDRVAAEKAADAERERQAREARRLEQLRPDAERLHAFACTLRALKAPELRSREARDCLEAIMGEIEHAAALADTFGRQETP